MRLTFGAPNDAQLAHIDLCPVVRLCDELDEAGQHSSRLPTGQLRLPTRGGGGLPTCFCTAHDRPGVPIRAIANNDDELHDLRWANQLSNAAGQRDQPCRLGPPCLVCHRRRERSEQMERNPLLSDGEGLPAPVETYPLNRSHLAWLFLHPAKRKFSYRLTVVFSLS